MDSLDIYIYVIVFGILGLCAYIYFCSDEFQLKCIVSTVDGNKYCVREREKVQDAADMLARVNEKCKKIVDYSNEKYGSKDCVKRLVKGYNPKKIMETLPTSEYTAYSENKGEKLAFCLNKKKGDDDNLIDANTLMFVATHEIAHVMTKSVGHTEEFWNNFKFLLENAVELKLYTPVDYKKEPEGYCGMNITDNPYYDL